MGISPDDLLNAAPRTLAPTFAEYVPIVSAAVGNGTRRVYGSYWNRVVTRWGERRLDEVNASDIDLSDVCTSLETGKVPGRFNRGALTPTISPALESVILTASGDRAMSAGDNIAAKLVGYAATR
ncbi:integrase [Paractinoplanes rishiriensis]|nr:integrase [Actinoplanes rishiriensis]